MLGFKTKDDISSILECLHYGDKIELLYRRPFWNPYRYTIKTMDVFLPNVYILPSTFEYMLAEELIQPNGASHNSLFFNITDKGSERRDHFIEGLFPVGVESPSGSTPDTNGGAS